MNKTIKTKYFVLPFLLSLPLLIGGCQGTGDLFGSSNERIYRPDHRPRDVYSGSQGATTRSGQRSSSSGRSSGSSYSITEQQGRTHHQTAEDNGSGNGEDDEAPTVPGTAPQLMD